MKSLKRLDKNKLISLILFSISILLIFTGLFGAQFAIKSNSNVVKTSCTNYGLTYYFHDVWKSLFTYEGLDKSINTFICITDLLTYFLLFGGIIFIAIKIINKLINKDYQINAFNYFRLISAFTIPLSAFLMLNHYFKATYYLDEYYYTLTCAYGWGAILIIIGYFFSLALLIFDEYQDNKNNLTNFIMRNISRLFLLLVIILSFKSLFSYRVEGLNVEYGIGEFIKDSLLTKRDGRTCVAFATYALVLSIFNISFIMDYLTQKDVSISKRHIVLMSLSLVFYISNGFFGKYGMWDYFGMDGSEKYYNFLYSWSSIVAIIFISIVLILTIILKINRGKTYESKRLSKTR